MLEGILNVYLRDLQVVTNVCKHIHLFHVSYDVVKMVYAKDMYGEWF